MAKANKLGYRTALPHDRQAPCARVSLHTCPAPTVTIQRTIPRKRPARVRASPSKRRSANPPPQASARAPIGLRGSRAPLAEEQDALWQHDRPIARVARHALFAHRAGIVTEGPKPLKHALKLSPDTSTEPNFYTGLKFGSKKHFYGRVAPEGILALHMEIDLFTAAERPERILVSKCTFTDPFRALSGKN